jgi:hypothetical protein
MAVVAFVYPFKVGEREKLRTFSVSNPGSKRSALSRLRTHKPAPTSSRKETVT